jgi:hypothetical protein
VWALFEGVAMGPLVVVSLAYSIAFVAALTWFLLQEGGSVAGAPPAEP